MVDFETTQLQTEEHSLANKVVEWPKLNLSSVHIAELSFHAHIAWDDDVAAELNELLGDRQMFMGATTYSRNRDRHGIVEYAYHEQSMEDIVITVSYIAGRNGPPAGTLPKEFRGFGELLARLNKISKECSIRCEADFVYAEGVATELETLFPLPMKMGEFEGDGLPMDEIRGIRGVKSKGDDGPLYSFILDRPQGSEILLTLWFTREHEFFTPELAKAGMAFAVEVAQKLVIGKEKLR